MSSPYDALAPSLVVEARGPLRVVTMNAPERLNAVDDDLHHALRVVWEIVEDDEDAGAVVFTGAGRAFCAGGHIPTFRRNYEDPASRRRDVRHAERLARAMIECEVPVVAAVNGPAVGLGASLAVLCDLVVMADDTYLMDPHVSVGVVAGDGGAVVWPLLMSLLHAKEYLLLGERMPAEECRRLGLANRVVPRDDVLATALALAERLAAQPRCAVRDTKRTLNMHLRQAADAALSFGLATERETFGGADVLATIERFEGDGKTVKQR